MATPILSAFADEYASSLTEQLQGLHQFGIAYLELRHADGKNVADVPPHKRSVNTVFQRYALFPHLNVYDNIAFGLRVKKIKESEIAEKVSEMLALVNLRNFEKRHISTLSGGQQPRAIATLCC